MHGRDSPPHTTAAIASGFVDVGAAADSDMGKTPTIKQKGEWKYMKCTSAEGPRLYVKTEQQVKPSSGRSACRTAAPDYVVLANSNAADQEERKWEASS